MSIDQRSAAFLAEMGIAPLWTLRGAPAEAPVAEEAPEPVVVARVNPDTPPMTSHVRPEGDSAWGEEPPAPPVTAEEIAVMDWARLKTAIASCTRCGLCKGGRKPVHGSGAHSASWFVAAGASTAADGQ